MSQMDDPPLGIGRAATPTPPAPTVPAPTATRPGLGISVPGPQGTPTTIALPNLPLPGITGSPGQATVTIPGARGTPPPNAKLTSEQAREKVKETLTSCRLLQSQIEVSQVTFDPPNWSVRLPLTGSTWTVNDDTGAVTADERAAERARTCRI